MRHQLLTLSILATLAGLWPATSDAESLYDFRFGLLGGLGGAFDAEPDPGFSNLGLEAYFSMETEERTRFAVRLGELDLDTDSSGFLPDTTLRYVTLSGEYASTASFYESLLFLGLGFYDAQDTLSLTNGQLLLRDDSALGLTLGTSGEFRLTDRLNLIVQFSGHYADLDFAQFFLMAHAGIGYHF